MRSKKQRLAAALLAAGVLIIGVGSCAAPYLPKPTVLYKDGVYTGQAEGMMGPLTVEVTIDKGAIVNVVLKEHHETQRYYEKAELWVVSSILEQQTTEVDAVSGATYTSKAIKNAVQDALRDARAWRVTREE